MMSAADFPEVFPWMREPRVKHPTPSCIARWEDDGGRCLEFSWGHPSAELRNRIPERPEDNPADLRWSLDCEMPFLRVQLRVSRR
jgi:hypothetical protein